MEHYIIYLRCDAPVPVPRIELGYNRSTADRVATTLNRETVATGFEPAETRSLNGSQDHRLTT